MNKELSIILKENNNVREQLIRNWGLVWLSKWNKEDIC